ncbi:hypothetical protein EVAR_24951_1 [Eumeta japonica]|uniref:Uncharacterized protein n=1 Tax=Eumeta variegata TaxID=151549 RepID=A0A4C1ZXQ1_EUMVA|nr:hypothetical protein EVAR_24951_1 [Eumeta japonica]
MGIEGRTDTEPRMNVNGRYANEKKHSIPIRAEPRAETSWYQRLSEGGLIEIELRQLKAAGHMWTGRRLLTAASTMRTSATNSLT